MWKFSFHKKKNLRIYILCPIIWISDEALHFIGPHLYTFLNQIHLSFCTTASCISRAAAVKTVSYAQKMFKDMFCCLIIIMVYKRCHSICKHCMHIYLVSSKQLLQFIIFYNTCLWCYNYETLQQHELPQRNNWSNTANLW